MSKINKQIAEAFHARRALSKSNTFTDGESVWLHGNKIIERRDGEIWVTAAGWATPTTKSRVNGVVGHLGRLYTQDGQLYIIAKPSGQHRAIEAHEWVNLGLSTTTHS